MLKIDKNLRLQTSHYGVNCYISSPSKIHINTVDTWSALEDIVRYLNSIAFYHKKGILSQQLSAMAPKMVEKKYSSDIVIYAFEYYAISWSSY